jgi:hypothetical protein
LVLLSLYKETSRIKFLVIPLNWHVMLDVVAKQRYVAGATTRVT